MYRNLTKEEVEKAISETKSMSQAAKALNVNYKTLRDSAKKFELFAPNQAGKGISKELKPIEEIKKAYNVKCKLWNQGLKKRECEICGLGEIWNEKEIILELHHIDGNKHNNVIENLQIVCPNCHSQTDNFRRRNKRSYKNVGMS